MVLLITQKFRASLDAQQGETEQAKKNKKQNLLNNALLLANWIQNFDSESINDCFD